MIQLPLFETPSVWTPPSHLPDLSDAQEIAIDTETKDPRLVPAGPGYIRRDGYVVGVGIAADNGFRGYFPLAHAGGGNLDPGIVCHWLREQVARPNVDYVFANAQYDLGWLRTLGVEVRGRINDIQIADTLLDEERPDGYSLAALCRRWGEDPKDEALLQEAASNWGLADLKAELWKLPAKLVGVYAEADPVRTLRIWKKQKPQLIAEGLWKAYELERELTPILFEMFWRGIRVDTDFASQLNQRWLVDEKQLLANLRLSADDLWNNAALAGLCDRNGIAYPRTAPSKNFPRGQPSINKEFMEHSDHPLLKQVRHARAVQRTRSIYLEQNLINNVINGRIHPQYIQMESDDGGTRTMRLACRNPNAQQFPKRSTLFDAKSLRKCLLPEDGYLWGKRDYWSQEPVIQCHYGLLGNLPGAREVAEGFRQGIKLYSYIEKAAQGSMNYDEAKAVALARSYNQQAKGMAEKNGISVEEAERIFAGFDNIVPYISMLNKSVQAKARTRRLHPHARRAQAALQLLGSAEVEARPEPQGHRLDADRGPRRGRAPLGRFPHRARLGLQGLQRPHPGRRRRPDQDRVGPYQSRHRLAADDRARRDLQVREGRERGGVDGRHHARLHPTPRSGAVRLGPRKDLVLT